MRFPQRLFLIILLTLSLLAFLVYIIRSSIRFAHIFGTHAGTLVTQQEAWDTYHSTPQGKKQHIPKILHQVFHNWKDPGSTELPEHWRSYQQSCLDVNPGWEHKVWSAEDSRDFLEREYPWFLATYDAYPRPVQRVDTVKYFLMLHYGGIYIDMDNGCLKSLDSLLYYPTFITDGGHGTLSNNILGSAPGHPFWKQVTSSLPAWSWNYILGYATVHYASGQWFIGAMWDRYHEELLSDTPDALHKGSDNFTNAPLTRISMDLRPGSPPWVFFNAGRGGSWIPADAKYFDFFGNYLVPRITEHPFLSGLGTLVVLGVLVSSCVWCRRRRRGRDGYVAVKEDYDLDDLGRDAGRTA